MSLDFTPEERAAIARRIDCPVPWCRGGWLEHGGDGGSPEHWFHEEDDGVDLGHGTTLSRSQEGSGSIVWTLSVRGQGLIDTTDSAEIARVLRELANEADRYARNAVPDSVHAMSGSDVWRNRDAVFRAKWAGRPVEEIIPAARRMLDRWTVGATEAHVRSYAEAVSRGEPFPVG